MKKEFPGLTTQKLKLIACISMLIDHMGFILFDNLTWMRAIGRIAFPAFAFFIAEGSKYSKKPLKRLVIMTLLGLICGACYFVALGEFDCNIFITFAFSVGIITLINNAKKALTDKNASYLFAIVSILLVGIAIIFVWYACDLLENEYGFAGAMVPVLVSLPDTHSMVKTPELLKKADNIFSKLFMLLIGILWLVEIYGAISLYALFAVPLLLLYNGKPGNRNLKWFFYIFYPAHVLLLEGIHLLIK